MGRGMGVLIVTNYLGVQAEGRRSKFEDRSSKHFSLQPIYLSDCHQLTQMPEVLCGHARCTPKSLQSIYLSSYNT